MQYYASQIFDTLDFELEMRRRKQNAFVFKLIETVHL